MRIKPINPYAKLLRDRKYKPQIIKNKKKYNRKRQRNEKEQKEYDRLFKNHEGD